MSIRWRLWIMPPFGLRPQFLLRKNILVSSCPIMMMNNIASMKKFILYNNWSIINYTVERKSLHTGEAWQISRQMNGDRWILQEVKQGYPFLWQYFDVFLVFFPWFFWDWTEGVTGRLTIEIFVVFIVAIDVVVSLSAGLVALSAETEK